MKLYRVATFFKIQRSSRLYTYRFAILQCAYLLLLQCKVLHAGIGHEFDVIGFGGADECFASSYNAIEMSVERPMV